MLFICYYFIDNSFIKEMIFYSSIYSIFLEASVKIIFIILFLSFVLFYLSVIIL